MLLRNLSNPELCGGLAISEVFGAATRRAPVPQAPKGAIAPRFPEKAQPSHKRRQFDEKACVVRLLNVTHLAILVKHYLPRGALPEHSLAVSG